MESGAQPGNTNAAKGTEWRQALKRALSRKSGKTFREGLDIAADLFVDAICDGNFQAMKELGDRIDGKPSQSIELGGPDGGPIPAVAWSILPVTPVDKADESGE